MSWRYLDLADYLVIAEAATGTSAETLMRVAQLHLAESALSAAASFGGIEFYPEFDGGAVRTDREKPRAPRRQ